MGRYRSAHAGKVIVEFEGVRQGLPFPSCSFKPGEERRGGLGRLAVG